MLSRMLEEEGNGEASCRSVSSGLLIRSRFRCPGCLTNRLLARNRAVHLLGCGIYIYSISGVEQLEGSPRGKGGEGDRHYVPISFSGEAFLRSLNVLLRFRFFLRESK